MRPESLVLSKSLPFQSDHRISVINVEIVIKPAYFEYCILWFAERNILSLAFFTFHILLTLRYSDLSPVSQRFFGKIARMNGRVRLRTSDTSETHGHKLRRYNLSSNSNAISVDVYWTLFGFYYCHRPLCMRYRCIELRRLHSFGGCCRFRPVAGSYCRRRSTADRNARKRGKKKKEKERDVYVYIY